MCFSVIHIDDLQSSNKKVVMDIPSSVYLADNLAFFLFFAYSTINVGVQGFGGKFLKLR